MHYKTLDPAAFKMPENNYNNNNNNMKYIALSACFSHFKRGQNTNYEKINCSTKLNYPKTKKTGLVINEEEENH